MTLVAGFRLTVSTSWICRFSATSRSSSASSPVGLAPAAASATERTRASLRSGTHGRGAPALASPAAPLACRYRRIYAARRRRPAPRDRPDSAAVLSYTCRNGPAAGRARRAGRAAGPQPDPGRCRTARCSRTACRATTPTRPGSPPSCAAASRPRSRPGRSGTSATGRPTGRSRSRPNPELGMAARLGLPIRERAARPMPRLTSGCRTRPAPSTRRSWPRVRPRRGPAGRPARRRPGTGPGSAARSTGWCGTCSVDGPADALDQLREACPRWSTARAPGRRRGADGRRPHRRARRWAAAAFGALANALTPALRPSAGYLGAQVATDHLLVLLHRRPGPPGDAAADRLLDGSTPSCPRHAVGSSTIAHRPRRAGPVARHGRSGGAPSRPLAAAELAALDPALPRRCRWSDLGALPEHPGPPARRPRPAGRAGRCRCRRPRCCC